MFHQKDYIYCVYKERSFLKAAEKLHISQPSLSAAVAKEERLLGQQIFNRRTTPISLTTYGQEYIRAVEQLYEIEERLQTLSFEYHTLQSGSLSIAASGLSLSYNVSQAIARYKKTYPSIELHVVETSTIGAKQMLDSGELDILITSRPVDTNRYIRICCDKEHLVWAVPKDFKVNKELKEYRLKPPELGRMILDIPDDRAVPASVFTQVPFILLNDTNHLRLCANNIFQESGIEPKIVLEFEHSTVSYNFACQGIGATIFSNRLVESEAYNKYLYFYKVRSRYASRNIYLCYNRSRHVTAAMSKAIEMMLHLQDE